MCIREHDIVSFGDQSAKAEKSRHLILVTKTNIWCATVMAKWVTSILTITYSPWKLIEHCTGIVRSYDDDHHSTMVNLRV